jgi:hypothetical protein
MRKLGLGLLLLAGVLSIGAGTRYLFTGEFMPYHAVVAGKSWSQLEPGVQTIILGMLKILGSGFASCGAALLWLLVPLRRNEVWARWAALTVAAVVWVPTQYVTFVLRDAAPQAQPPIIPTAIILLLVALGVGALFVAPSTRTHEAV